MHRRHIAIVFLIFLLSSLSPYASRQVPAQEAGIDSFAFALTSDILQYAGDGIYDTPQYYRGAIEAIDAHGPVAFMVSPGDVSPLGNLLYTINTYLFSGFLWYPVVGNHEEETPADMEDLRTFDYGPVNPGPTGCPKTTYSFDYGNTHFVMLNEYCDVTGDNVTVGDITDHLYNWLVADLAATQQTHILVFGHEPAYPQPDADNGRLRHEYDSLNADLAHRDRFWSLLESEGVVAYICGHTHNYSLVDVNGVWQLDVGHARGLGDPYARSTFALVSINGPVISYETYRDDSNGGPYTLRYQGLLEGAQIYLPVMIR